MDINTIEGCCSVVEISYFHTGVDRKLIMQKLKDFYEDYLWNSSLEYPRVLIATTKTSIQADAETALTELGFTKKKIHSRHRRLRDKPALTFWMRTSLPLELRTFIKNELRKLRKEGYD